MMSVKAIFLTKLCFNQLGFTVSSRGDLICLIKRDVFECESFREIVYCMRLFASLVIHAAHLLVDSFLTFDGGENVGIMDIIL